MGLDMSLEREVYIGGFYDHRGVSGTCEFNIKPQTRTTNGDKHYVIPVSTLSSIIQRVMYWRKANAIHAWFVSNVQDGEDNCGRYAVSKDDLISLRDLCKATIAEEDPAMLPTSSGFFFGSTEYDNWYWADLKETEKTLSDVINDEQFGSDDYDITYYYSSSW